jgi:hypothetical protein
MRPDSDAAALRILHRFSEPNIPANSPLQMNAVTRPCKGLAKPTRHQISSCASALL